MFLLSLQEIEKYGLSNEGVPTIAAPNNKVNYYSFAHTSSKGYLAKANYYWVSRTISLPEERKGYYSVFFLDQAGTSCKATVRPAMWIDLSCSADVDKRIADENEAERQRVEHEKTAEAEHQRIVAEQVKKLEHQRKISSARESFKMSFGFLAGFFVLAWWMINDWTNGTPIGWGVICCIGAIVCGLGSITLIKEWYNNKLQAEGAGSTAKGISLFVLAFAVVIVLLVLITSLYINGY